MEFKANYCIQVLLHLFVDIATEWNLKTSEQIEALMEAMVDIATEWNLKMTMYHRAEKGRSRYSNRMEFKVIRLITRKSR